MVERWTAGWLEATRHKVVSPCPGEAPRQSLVLFQAHDDDIYVEPLKAEHLLPTELAAARSKMAADNVRDGTLRPRRWRRDTMSSGPIPVSVSFAEWVLRRPRSALSKYPGVTQGDWVSRNELKAKAALRDGR